MSITVTPSTGNSTNLEMLHFDQLAARYEPKPLYDLSKQVLETLVAILILILFSPLWLIVAVAIKLTSPGPVLFKGRVVGRDGQEFTYYKFRSMTHNNDNSQHKAFIENYVKQHLAVKTALPEALTFDEDVTVKLSGSAGNFSADSGGSTTLAETRTLKLHLEKTDSQEIIIPGHHDSPTLRLQKTQLNLHEEGKPALAQFKLTNDLRVTRIGSIIRKLSIDEVPQMFNVVKGQMAIVGPRPPVPYEFALYDETCKRRLTVRPGITGLAQVEARGNVSFQQMLAYDFEYIQRRSIILDIKIMFRTPLAMLKGA